MTEMKAEYRGYEIEWRDWSKTFDISQDGSTVKQRLDTIEACEKWIDAKEKTKYKRVPVWIEGSGWRLRGEWLHGEATSLIDNEYVWFVNDKKERSKEPIDLLYLDTPETVSTIHQIKMKEVEIRAIQEDIDKLKESLPPLTADMMVEK